MATFFAVAVLARVDQCDLVFKFFFFIFYFINLSDLLENGLEDTGRGKGKLGQSDIYTLPNVKPIASGKQPHSTGTSAWCFVTT